MVLKTSSCTRILSKKIVIIVLVALVFAQYVANMMAHRGQRGTLFSIVMDHLQSKTHRSMRSDFPDNVTTRSITQSRVVMPDCPIIPPQLKGRLDVNIQIPSWAEIEAANPGLSPGGRYSPPDCTARSRVAIIIPYRDREMHLKIFLRNIHPFLQRQQLDYGIYVVELVAGVKFNRALLMNIGFVEAAKVYPYQCFIFHDVDLLPEDDRNLYSCPDMPRHMSVAIDKLKYKLPYPQLFGGVSAINKEQFLKINGFSNVFFGWGGEDDDMYKRIIYTNLTVTRYSQEVGRYKMLTHRKEKGNPERHAILKTTNMRRRTDGVNSLKYKVINMTNKPLFTWIFVTFNETSILKDEKIHKLATKLPAKVVKPRGKALVKVFRPQRPAIISWVPTNGTAPKTLTGNETLAYNKVNSIPNKAAGSASVGNGVNAIAKIANRGPKLKPANQHNILAQLKKARNQLEQLQRQLVAQQRRNQP